MNAEHSCDWCTRPARRVRIIHLALAKKKNPEIAARVGVSTPTVCNVLTEARKRGCITAEATGRRRPNREHKAVCKLCGAGYTARRAGTAYCSPKCAKAGRDSGIRIYEDEDPRELGPAEPPIKPDVEGMWRRCLSDAKDGLSEKALTERFGSKQAQRAIREALRLGFRAPVLSSRGRYSFMTLPFGPPL